MCFSRPRWEGGQYDGDEESRLHVLQLAMEFGADYIDVELKVIFYSVQDYFHTKTIIKIIILN